MNTKIFFFGLIFGMISIGGTTAYADHSQAEVSIMTGSEIQGCDEHDMCLSSSMVTLDVGGEVIWTNHGVSKITITSGTASDGPDGTFDSGLLATGESFSFTFEEHGEFTYFSQIQPWIVGTITVQKVHGDEHSDMGTDHESEMKHDSETDHESEMKHDSETDHESEMKHDDKEMHMPEGDVSATGMLSDGTVIKLWASVPTKDEMMEIMMEFEDAKHVNHDLLVTQNGEEVLHDTGAHHMSGFGTHTTAPLHSSDPVDVVVTFQGYGMNDDKTGPIGEQVKFANVIPEFGTIAMMVLAVAIISIVAVTAKSRVIPRF